MEIRPLLTPRISKEKFVKKQEILTQLRTKHEKSSLEKELFMGEIEILSTSTNTASPELSLSVTFNSNHSSWDYSWKSNRWLGPNEFHVVDIIVLKYHSPTEFEVASNTTSDPFIVVSSHKKSVPSTVPVHGFADIVEGEANINKDVLPTTAATLEANKMDNITPVAAVKKRNTTPTRKRQSNSNALITREETTDMDVLEGAQLLGALSGNIISLPTKTNSVDLMEEDLPAPETSTHNVSNPQVAANSTLSSNALAVVFPVTSTSTRPLPMPTTTVSISETTATVAPSTINNTSKKVAISHDKHLRLYEVHYPNLSLIEEVRNNPLQLPKQKKSLHNHVQLPNRELNSEIQPVVINSMSGEISSSSSSKRLSKPRGNLNPALISTGKRPSSITAGTNRNHRQLPDKDPNPSSNSSGEEGTLPSDAIRAGAHQLLLLSSKEGKLEAQATVDGFYGENGSTNSALSSSSPIPSRVPSRNKRKRRATYPTTTDEGEDDEETYPVPDESSLSHLEENSSSLLTLAASASQVAHQEISSSSIPTSTTTKKIRLPSSLRMSISSNRSENNDSNSNGASLTQQSITSSNGHISKPQPYYHVFQLPGKPVEEDP